MEGTLIPKTRRVARTALPSSPRQLIDYCDRPATADQFSIKNTDLRNQQGPILHRLRTKLPFYPLETLEPIVEINTVQKIMFDRIGRAISFLPVQRCRQEEQSRYRCLVVVLREMKLQHHSLQYIEQKILDKLDRVPPSPTNPSLLLLLLLLPRSWFFHTPLPPSPLKLHPSPCTRLIIDFSHFILRASFSIDSHEFVIDPVRMTIRSSHALDLFVFSSIVARSRTRGVLEYILFINPISFVVLRRKSKAQQREKPFVRMLIARRLRHNRGRLSVPDQNSF